MEINKKWIGMGVVTASVIGFAYYFYGIFTPYNYFTAKFAVMNGKVELLTYGLPHRSQALENQLAAEFGFNYRSVAGCEVSNVLINGVNQYNAVTNAYLVDKNGENWEAKFDERVKYALEKQR